MTETTKRIINDLIAARESLKNVGLPEDELTLIRDAASNLLADAWRYLHRCWGPQD